jgi:hypothetical protein
MLRAGVDPRTSKAVTASVNSLNWGGYGLSGRSGAFTSVAATFVVPAVASCGATESSASSFWAGIDGLTSSSTTVEQDGVDAVCTDGTVGYFAWYEVYPAPPVTYAHVTVHAGDAVQATVTSEGGGSYRLRLVDSTDGTNGTMTTSRSGATNSSAECIAEDPGSPQVPYTDYGSVSFSSCTANGEAIGSLNPTVITTVTSGGTTDAVPSALANNTTFSVTRIVPSVVVAPTPAPTPVPVPTPTPTPTPSPSPSPTAVVGMASTPSGNGYWLANASGGVAAHGGAAFYGSMASVRLDAPITHIVSTADGLGYWLVASDGGIFAFGDARFLGSMGGHHLNAPVVDMAPTADGLGYWLVASDGGIFAFGDAPFRGSMGSQRLNAPVVAITADSHTGGYWEVASDGGVFAFGAPFLGSTGALHLNRPIVSMAAGGNGYWFVASDGGVFAFGAPFHGSGGGHTLSAPIVGMAADAATGGYWLVGRDGAVYSFGAPFYGADGPFVR